MKLTPLKREFFENYAKESIKSMLVLQTKPEYKSVVAQAADVVLADTDVSVLAHAIAVSMLAECDFKVIRKVDTMLRSADVISVTTAGQKTILAVQDDLAATLVGVGSKIEEVLTADGAYEEAAAE